VPAAVEGGEGVNGAGCKHKEEELEFHQLGRGWVVKARQR
jgi:hypothetical protein